MSTSHWQYRRKCSAPGPVCSKQGGFYDAVTSTAQPYVPRLALNWRAAAYAQAATRPCRRINDPYARQPSMHIARDRLWPVQGWAGLKFGRCQSTPPVAR